MQTKYFIEGHITGSFQENYIGVSAVDIPSQIFNATMKSWEQVLGRRLHRWGRDVRKCGLFNYRSGRGGRVHAPNLVITHLLPLSWETFHGSQWPRLLS